MREPGEQRGSLQATAPPLTSVASDPAKNRHDSALELLPVAHPTGVKLKTTQPPAPGEGLVAATASLISTRDELCAQSSGLRPGAR